MQSVKIPRKISMLRRNSLWLTGYLLRTFTKTAVSCANHYDVLGITPKATQNDIKSAYYKLSKVYHPDRSGNEDDAKKFRAISEAYEVLGNIKLKKMYDKGLLVGKENTTRMHYHPEPEPTDPTLKFYKSRVRKVVRMPDGTAPIYDFDAWSKHHYGDLVRKSREAKESIRKTQSYKTERVLAERQEGLIYVMLALTALFGFMVTYGKDDYDRVQDIPTTNNNGINSK